MAAMMILIVGSTAILLGWTVAILRVYRGLAASKPEELGPLIERIEPATEPVPAG